MLAEIGIALLLFTAGLDFSVTGLRRTWGRVVFGGAAQMVLTAAVVMAIAVALGESGVRRLVVLGVFVALSSTAIVIKELTRHNQAHSPHGQLAIGVLLLQDLAVIVLLVLTPVLFGGDAALRGGSLPGAIVRVMAVLAGVALVARMVLPALVRLVSTTGREAFSLAVLLASIGTAWLTSLAGLSMAVGAFLAGLVLAESEVSHQVHAEVRPLRDLLASLFFISVGMLVDPRALAGADTPADRSRGPHPRGEGPLGGRRVRPHPHTASGGGGSRHSARAGRRVLAALRRHRADSGLDQRPGLAAAARRGHPHDDGSARPGRIRARGRCPGCELVEARRTPRASRRRRT